MSTVQHWSCLRIIGMDNSRLCYKVPDFTELETCQLDFCILEKVKIILSTPYLKQNSCYHLCFLQLNQTRGRSHATKKANRKRRNSKTATPFPKWNINMTIQSQVLTMHTLTSLLYMLQPDQQKAPINKLSHSKIDTAN